MLEELRSASQAVRYIIMYERQETVMAQGKMDRRPKFASAAFALKRMATQVRVSRGRDEDFISVDRQREQKVGPTTIVTPSRSSMR